MLIIEFKMVTIAIIIPYSTSLSTVEYFTAKAIPNFKNESKIDIKEITKKFS